ncbi:MAG: hypothetical protein AAFP13_05760 [Pseudomonadota bacterium]
MRQLVVFLCLVSLSACSLVTETRNGREATSLVLGAPSLTAPADGAQVVDISALGAVSRPGGLSLGLVRHRSAIFPASCGAIFIDPDEATIARLSDILPNLSDDCILQRSSS